MIWFGGTRVLMKRIGDYRILYIVNEEKRRYVEKRFEFRVCCLSVPVVVL
ncbi:MAG: hypothetical protein FGF52_05165 [Candidatus Brockarchaeota archaeon]|nr:hypothetical protein [Candidatus Brockarchaeota archaeon]